MEQARLTYTVDVSQLCQVWAVNFLLLILQFNYIWFYLNKKTELFNFAYFCSLNYGNNLALRQIQTQVTVSEVFMRTAFLSSKSRWRKTKAPEWEEATEKGRNVPACQKCATASTIQC